VVLFLTELPIIKSMINIKSKNFFIVFVLVVLIGFFIKNIFHFRQDGVKELSVREYVVQSFLSELPSINKQLPHRLDDETLLNSIGYYDGRVVSDYRLVRIKSGDDFKSVFDKKIVPAIVAQTCNDEFKKRLLDVDVELVSRYTDSAGIEISRITMTRESCAEFQESQVAR